MATEPQHSPQHGAPTRLFALLVLGAVASAVVYAGQEVYHAATDSFVAPIILTPDNDAVIASKLSFSQLEVERAKTAAEIEGIDADLAAGQKAVARLETLLGTVTRSLTWTQNVNRRLLSKGAVDLKALDDQAAVLKTMLEEQERLTRSAGANLEAGLIANGDYVKEMQSLNQLRIALLEKSRTRAEGDAQLEEVQRARDSLARSRRAPAMPEQIMREDQLVRVELELLKLESEQRTKQTEKKLAQEKLAKIHELEAQLKARPIFRATERNLDVAFVPYTQLEGVEQGAEVYSCTWGLFHCRLAGRVAELVPGEVILPDPWGNQARGQYAVLELQNHAAARAKTLRIREGR